MEILESEFDSTQGDVHRRIESQHVVNFLINAQLLPLQQFHIYGGGIEHPPVHSKLIHAATT